MDVTDATAAGRQRVLTLSDLVGTPLRRWPHVLAAVAVAVAAVLGYLTLMPATYTATAVVVVRPVVTDPFAYPSGGADRVLNMNAENGIATGNEVVDQVASTIRRRPEQVRRALRVEVPVGGQVLRFVYSARSARESVLAANSAADGYLRVRMAGYDDQRASLLRSYDATIASVTNQRNAAQQALPGPSPATSSSPAASAAVDQVRALNNQLAQLVEQRARVASVNVAPGSVTGPARAPVPSSHDAGALYLVAAVLGGLLIGGVIAFVRESADRRVRSVAQAEETSGLPLIGTVRRARRGRQSPAAGADIRYVALAMTQRAERAPGQPIVVLSTRADEGGRELVGALAVALAAAGHRVYVGTDAADRLRARLLVGQRRHLVLPRAGTTGAARLGRHPDVEAAPRAGGPHPAGMATAGGPPTDAVAATSVLLDDGPPAPSTEVRPARTDDEQVHPERTDDEPAESQVVRIGAGTVRLGALDAHHPPGHLVLLDPPAAETDERGVRLARTGSALIVVARGRTRAVELARLADRVRAAGAQAMGIVLVGDGRG